MTSFSDVIKKEMLEANAMAEMRAVFAGVDGHAPKGEPSAKDRALINQLIKRHRQKRNGA